MGDDSTLELATERIFSLPIEKPELEK